MPGKKFLLLSSRTLPDTSGSGINAYNFAMALQKNEHKAKVLTFRRSFHVQKDSNVIRIPYFSKTLFGKLFSLPLILLSYLFFIPRSNVLIIYGSKIIAWEPALIIAKLFRTKIVFQSLLPGVDNLSALLGKSYTHKRFYRYIFSLIDGYHSINQIFSSDWKSLIKEENKLLEFPQGVDHLKFSPIESTDHKKLLRKKLGLPEDSLLFVTSGFLIERKGLKIILKALSTLDLDFRLLHLGESRFGKNHFLRSHIHEADQLKTLAQKLLGDKIVFRGFKPNAHEYFRCADIYIHGNANEGLPNVFLEAMSSGVPILTYPINGLKEFTLKNRNNCLIYSSEPEFNNGIIELQENQNLRKSIISEARLFVEKEASFTIVIQKLLTFLYS